MKLEAMAHMGILRVSAESNLLSDQGGKDVFRIVNIVCMTSQAAVGPQPITVSQLTMISPRGPKKKMQLSVRSC